MNCPIRLSPRTVRACAVDVRRRKRRSLDRELRELAKKEAYLSAVNLILFAIHKIIQGIRYKSIMEEVAQVVGGRCIDIEGKVGTESILIQHLKRLQT